MTKKDIIKQITLFSIKIDLISKKILVKFHTQSIQILDNKKEENKKDKKTRNLDIEKSFEYKVIRNG